MAIKSQELPRINTSTLLKSFSGSSVKGYRHHSCEEEITLRQNYKMCQV